jgi:hypothetical protein
VKCGFFLRKKPLGDLPPVYSGSQTSLMVFDARGKKEMHGDETAWEGFELDGRGGFGAGRRRTGANC